MHQIYNTLYITGATSPYLYNTLYNRSHVTLPLQYTL
jgi:hypothetical protein